MAANIYQAVKQAMQDLIAPQIESVKGDIAALRAELQGGHATLHAEIDSVRAEIGSVRSEVESVRREVHLLDDKLTWALDLRERIVALETKLAT